MNIDKLIQESGGSKGIRQPISYENALNKVVKSCKKSFFAKNKLYIHSIKDKVCILATPHEAGEVKNPSYQKEILIKNSGWVGEFTVPNDLIYTTDMDKALIAGHGIAYRAFVADSDTLVVSPDKEWGNAFRPMGKSAQYFIELLKNYGSLMGELSGMPSKMFSDHIGAYASLLEKQGRIRASESLERLIKTPGKAKYVVNDLMTLHENIWKHGLMDFVDKEFRPRENGFTVVNPNRIPNKALSLWTSGATVLVDIDVEEQFCLEVSKRLLKK